MSDELPLPAESAVPSATPRFLPPELTDLLERLAAPFDPLEVHWRLGRTREAEGNKPARGMALAYVDARNVERRLDAVIGCENWQSDFSQGPEGIVFCRLNVYLWPIDRWVSKMNGAGKSDIEAEKGAVSGAMKRAASSGFGIGRYLYELESPWVNVEKRGRSYAIQQDQYVGLRKALADRLTDRERLTMGQAKLRQWLSDRGVGWTLIAGYLGLGPDDDWTSVTSEQLDGLRQQAQLVHAGEMSPEEAFGQTAEQRAAELEGKIRGANPPTEESQ